MAIKYVTEMRPCRLEVERTCDMCSEVIVEKNRDIMDTIVQARYGERDYGGGGHVNIFEADICIPCFKNKVVPALEALGLKDVEWKEVDF